MEHHQTGGVLAGAGFGGGAVEKRDIGQTQLGEDLRHPLDDVLDERVDVRRLRVQLQAGSPVGPQIRRRRHAGGAADQGRQQHGGKGIGDAARTVDVDGLEQRAEEPVDALHLIHPDAAPGHQGLCAAIRIGVGGQGGQTPPKIDVRGGEPGAKGIRIMRRIGHDWVHTLLFGVPWSGPFRKPAIGLHSNDDRPGRPHGPRLRRRARPAAGRARPPPSRRSTSPPSPQPSPCPR